MWINDGNVTKEQIKWYITNYKKVIVYIGRQSCTHIKSFFINMDKAIDFILSNNPPYLDHFVIIKADTLLNQDIKTFYNTRGPLLIFYKNGEEVYKDDLMLAEIEYRKKIRKFLFQDD